MTAEVDLAHKIVRMIEDTENAKRDYIAQAQVQFNLQIAVFDAQIQVLKNTLKNDDQEAEDALPV